MLMNGQWFSEGYQKAPTWHDRMEDAEKQLIEPHLQWSDTFSLALHNYLRGGTVTRQEADGFIDHYGAWLNGDFSQTSSDTLVQLTKEGSPNSSLVLFHIMNTQFINIWRKMLAGETRFRPDLIEATQNNLAARSIDIMNGRSTAMGEGMFFAPDFDDDRALMNGVLNEYDTAISALEITKKHPSIVVLPSPAMFSGSDNVDRNSNFIVIDTNVQKDGEVQRFAKGIQTSTQTRRESAEDADPDFIVHVDGTADLGNSKVVRYDPKSSKMAEKPWPGYIAAHHLAMTKKPIAIDQETKKRMQKVNPRYTSQLIIRAANYLYTAKSDAAEHVGASKPLNEKAAQIILDRVMDGLYD